MDNIVGFLSFSRDTRSADISLFAVTMNQHPGPGFVLIYVYIACSLSAISMHFLCSVNSHCLKKCQLDCEFSDEHGDQPRPLPSVKELNSATDITERKESPAWDFDVWICSVNFFKPLTNLAQLHSSTDIYERSNIISSAILE